MATKKRTKVPAPSPDDSQRPESEANVETTRNMNVDTDVERVDSDASPEIGSVEGRDNPPTASMLNMVVKSTLEMSSEEGPNGRTNVVTLR